jgi:hypothetical protein
MGCIKSRSKIWGEIVGGLVILISLVLPTSSWAAFASQFSLGVGEEYNDNIFFSKQKDHDFISTLLPTLSFFYAPAGQIEPTATLSIGSTGEFYARHSELNNFGKNFVVQGAYAYRYSPQLSFDFADNLQRQGPTRTGGFGFGQPLQLQTGPTTLGSNVTKSQDLKDFISQGDQITNSFGVNGSYLYRPDVSFTGFYQNTVAQFLDAGGTEVSHTIGARGIYNWRQDHNLHAGYSISINKSRNGGNEDGVIHNFDFGDDYFSNYNLQLTPTLSLTASSGLSFNAGKDGPRIANNTNITITKLWEAGVLNAGFRKGLTPSFGVAGISDTMSIFTTLAFRFSEKLSTNANVNLSFYDTEDVNFKTFEAAMGLQYMINSWLSAALNYRFRWIDGGSGANQSGSSGANQTDLLNKGIINSNSVFLVLTGRFDLWPNIGLARGLSSTTLNPVLKTPFPLPAIKPSNIP